ncbi:MAG TPA: hypothetical protein VNN79_23895, partial [Actinomycetota bacterium]|nr:hypothetical protein [Actinomycetota bacterium]
HASTLSPLRLGENPTNVDTYSQLALLNDNEQGKRGSIIAEHREGIGHLVMLSLSDVEEYWPDEKQGLILGPEQSVESVTLKKSDIPTQYRVRPATGQPQPRSQGAQVKKIDAIWQAAVASLVVQTDPAAWTDWYKRSLEAGQPQKLPAAGATSQDQIISLENMLMRQGEWVEPAYYDPIQLHVPGHRMEQDRARAEGDTPTAQLLEQHIQRHLYWSTVNAQQQAAIGPQPEPQDATTGGPATESQPAQGSSAGPPVPPTSTP